MELSNKSGGLISPADYYTSFTFNTNCLMKLYAQLKLMGFFAWLKDTHEIPFPSDDDITELDNTPADDIGAVALRAMVFKYFRDEHRYNGETPFLINIGALHPFEN